MKLVLLLGAALVGLVLAPVPAARANDPCPPTSPAFSVQSTHVGILKGDCIGVHAWDNTLPCGTAHWGLMTLYGGVGGHSGCEVRAYVVYWWADPLLP